MMRTKREKGKGEMLQKEIKGKKKKKGYKRDKKSKMKTKGKHK